MKGHEPVLSPAFERLPAQPDDLSMPHFSIGDRIRGPVRGIVVDLEKDAVVVARRNAQGRCMEIVFVGDSAKTLRTA